MSRVYRCETSYFTAAVATDDKGIVIKAAPILQWSIGKSIKDVQAFCRRKGGKAEWVNKEKEKSAS